MGECQQGGKRLGVVLWGLEVEAEKEVGRAKGWEGATQMSFPKSDGI